MERLLALISPFASLPIFLALNAIICLISIYWVFANVKYEKNPKYHKTIQAIGLVVSLFVIAILWIKQWNIGDLLAFYVLFASIIFIASLFLNNKLVRKESRGWFLSIVLVFLIRGYFYEPWQIPSGSMKPNMEIGDFVLVNRYKYGLEVPFTGRTKIFSAPPEIGEVVVFYPPHKPNVPFVKRVIAKGGDEVSYVNKRFFINGEEILKNFLSDGELGEKIFYEELNGKRYVVRNLDRAARNKTWMVPEGMFFVVGDNRDNSSDSRSWGFISEDDIWGRADFIWLSWESGEFPSISRAGEIK